MRDHNESHESPPHREHPNHSPWGGDGVDEEDGHPCDEPRATRTTGE